MPTLDPDTLNGDLIALLAGDQQAGNAVYSKIRAAIRNVARKYGLEVNDRDDVLNEAILLMLEAPERFDPERGSAVAFILTVVIPEAIQRVRSKMAKPGTTTRRRKPNPCGSVSWSLERLSDPQSVPVMGYGSHSAMEAACDAHIVWSRSNAQVRQIVAAYAEGRNFREIAAELNIDRFKVARSIKAAAAFARAA